MLKNNMVWIVGGVLVAGLVGWYLMSRSITPGQYDELAQCLNQKGVTEYGAYWCPHCQEQKRVFGKSFKYLNYVECSLPNKGGQTPACKEAGITSYPTWQMADGERRTGKLSPEKLGEINGCEI